MQILLKSTAARVVGRGYLSSDHLSTATGLDPAFTISKNGGNFANPAAGASVMTEVETTGWYYFALGTGDTDTLGPLIVRGTHATMDHIEVVCQVVETVTAANATQWAGTAITATSIPVATAAGASGGLGIAGSNAATTFANLTVSGTSALGSVTGTLPANFITATAIATGAITNAKFAAGAIDAAAIANDAIDLATFAADVKTGSALKANVETITTGAITAAAIAADAIGADEIAAGAVTKIQAGLATPTNITAGTITTVTNLTNAPTTGDLTATMKTSVTTAATAATPTAAAVTGDTKQTADVATLIATVGAAGAGLTALPQLPTLAITTGHAHAGGSASSFGSSLTQADNVWNDALIVFTSGGLVGQVKEIGDFANTSGVITLTSGQAFTAAPADNDTFTIINR